MAVGAAKLLAQKSAAASVLILSIEGMFNPFYK
ncbi:hypothetical protein swp_2343 [Shewanella piezotolerans WP3]|uniref:Uncharacterized protein n=1 Tax=Shewanella piezotolerans (strain WP3 / JCM 13877) TaxID=225849 RepID=B8CNW9_SHEPW|nr:hypothetical protein swp_2343 [Shewanella piezotolerans WP3]